jgi:shikimate kinase
LPEAITNAIVVLIGFAGTGKYTIGRELADRTGAKLIHNHPINNSRRAPSIGGISHWRNDRLFDRSQVYSYQ